MNKKVLVFILIVITFIFVSGLWAIDIGASGANMQSAGYELQAEGLLFSRTPTAQYHLGLLIASVCFLVVVVMYIFKIIGDKE